MTFTNTTSTPTPAPIQKRSDSRGLRIGGVIAIALAGLALVGAAGLLSVHYGQRDEAGYYRSAAVAVSSNGYAISSAGLDIGSLNGAETFVANGLFERVRMSASTTTGKPIFIGLARQNDLEAYLSGSARTVVSDVRDDHTAITHDLAGALLAAHRPSRASGVRRQAAAGN